MYTALSETSNNIDAIICLCDRTSCVVIYVCRSSPGVWSCQSPTVNTSVWILGVLSYDIWLILMHIRRRLKPLWWKTSLRARARVTIYSDTGPVATQFSERAGDGGKTGLACRPRIRWAWLPVISYTQSCHLATVKFNTFCNCQAMELYLNQQ